MYWTELRVETTPAAADLVAEFMLEADLRGASVTVTEAGAACCAYLPPHSSIEGVVERLRRRLVGIDPSLTNGLQAELSVCQVEEQDWAEAWRQHWQPLRVGQRLVVKPSWCDFQARPQDVVIELDPGMAFGTGTHPTTRMCLELLEELTRPGLVVLDVGTGSGILAIAAAKLGAARVLAIDNDPLAVRVARDNVSRNQALEVVEVRLDNALDSVVEPADLVVANISTEAACALASGAAALLGRHGRFVSAGMTEASVDAVRSALAAAGLRVTGAKQEAEWVCLVAQR